MLEDPLSEQNMNVVISLIEGIGLNWLSNLIKLPQLIENLHENAWFTLQTRFPWPVVWYVHSCWSSARIDTCRCRYEGARALLLLRRIKWCSTKDALELQCEWNPRIASLTWCALLCGYSIAPRINKGLWRRVFRGPPMWQGSLEHYLSSASSRDPHIPHLEAVERVRRLCKPLFFPLFSFLTLSHMH